MQRVSSLLPLWERAKPVDSTGDGAAKRASSNTIPTASKANRPSKKFSWADRIGLGRSLSVSPATASTGSMRPVSVSVTVPRQMGREAYWPTTLDHECEKAARILKSFCTDGFLDEAVDSIPTSPTSRSSITSLSSPRFPSRRSNDAPPTSPTTSVSTVKKKIPPRVVQEAVGLAIFSCMRSGLWMSGSGGSGILIARKADGTWSPPSGIMLHTSTLAFVIGVDIYDCVLIINSVTALEMFTRPRLTLGADVPLTVGPLTTVGLLENDFRWNNEMGNTVLTYLKARGRYRPAQLHGSLVTERSNENERFYSEDNTSGGTEPIDVLDILAGNIGKSVPEIVPLFEAIKAAEGRSDFDAAIMEQLSMQPAPGDADIVDTPALLPPTSPKASNFGLLDAADPDPFGIIALEMAGLEIREAGSKHRPSSNQFDYTASPTSPTFTHFNRQSADATLEHGSRASYMSTRTQATSMNDACTQTDVAETPDTSFSPTHSDDGKDGHASTTSEKVSSPVPELALRNSPVALATASRESRIIQAKGSLVTIPKRIPPPLPLRSPARRSRAGISDFGDMSATNTPFRQSFQSTSALLTPSAQPEAETTEAPTARSVEIAASTLPTETTASAVTLPEFISAEKAVPTPSPSSTVVEFSATVAKEAKKEDSVDSSPMSRTTEFTASSVDDSDREPRTPRLDEHSAVAECGSLSAVKPEEDLEGEAQMGPPNSSTITVV
ncbi:duf500 domain containing protein [Grosmannia clavigera kw1407]|uniref:Duf500 domain containing protein n=1 Tax=Grosmannia clavigera (strain kw1407 / UAMH 11150) TaxID=655863 RepID=F0XI14_GROCL|nr:duf500 domain containing protein [Grosmannia clavigera kw1407]EFX02589.1 duf500 domain containing protein [Grosmannia clavigera kw1407]